MKTVLVHRPGGPEALDYVDAPMPAPGEREVLIRAEAFGVGQPDELIRAASTNGCRRCRPIPATTLPARSKP